MPLSEIVWFAGVFSRKENRERRNVCMRTSFETCMVIKTINPSVSYFLSYFVEDASQLAEISISLGEIFNCFGEIGYFSRKYEFPQKSAIYRSKVHFI